MYVVNVDNNQRYNQLVRSEVCVYVSLIYIRCSVITICSGFKCFWFPQIKSMQWDMFTPKWIYFKMWAAVCPEKTSCIGRRRWQSLHWYILVASLLYLSNPAQSIVFKTESEHLILSRYLFNEPKIMYCLRAQLHKMLVPFVFKHYKNN